jgi:hypothetical protein
MFDLEFDAKPLEQKFAQMAAKLEALPTAIASQLTDWQTEDMKRKYPNTDLQDNVAATTIWPRSRLELAEVAPRRLVRTMRRRTRELRQGRLPPGQRVSTRPILRPALLEQLHERMIALLESLTWR